MKLLKISLASLLLMGMAYAMPLNSSARACVPADLLQLISVDYRALKDSPTAALKAIGLDPETDVDTLTFASFRAGKQGVKTIGVAAGPFDKKAVLKKMKLQKYVPKKYGTVDIYPMDGGFVMTFLDDSTLLFGDSTSVRVAIDTSNGQVLSVDTNGDMADMMSSVDSSPVWCTPLWEMPPRSPISIPSRNACWARVIP
jgi:hypothetical protein